MTLLQKTINLAALIALFLFLSHFHQQINAVRHDETVVLAVAKRIMKAQELRDEDISNIKRIAQQEHDSDDNDGLRCFLEMYKQFVLDKSLSEVDSLFTILAQSSKGEYANVQGCSHFISLLIYKAESLSIEPKAKSKVLQYLNKQLKQQFINKYSSSAKMNVQDVQNRHICVLKYAKNGQSTIEQGVLSLINQDYTYSNSQIEVDGKKDSTYMHAKFTLDENKQKQLGSIMVVSDEKTQGIIKRMKLFTEEQCKENSIVLILERDQVLLSSEVFTLIDLVFEEPSVKLAIFNTLTINHTNTQNTTNQKSLLESEQLYPVIAIEREALTASISQFQAHKDIEKIYSSDFQYYIWLRELMKGKTIGDRERKHIEQIVAYRFQRGRVQELRLAEWLSKFD